MMAEQEKLDVFSSNFDPLRALYSSETNVPFPDVIIFNNVAAYESGLNPKERKGDRNVQQGSSSQSRGKPPRPRGRGRGSRGRGARVQTQPVLLMPDDSMPAARRRMLTNVLTRMDQSFVSGPLSILRRCVQENLKAHIWTRSAASVRGVLKGFIVAFDKHFNIAMIDVDEVYRIPSACKKKLRKAQAKAKKAEKLEESLSVAMEQRLDIRDTRRPVKERLSLPKASTSKSSDRDEPRPSSSERGYGQSRLSSSDRGYGKSKPKSSERDSEISRHGSSERLQQKSRPGSSERGYRRGSSEKDSHSSKYSRDFAKSKCERIMSIEAAWLGVKPSDVQFRHVNQLFIRGDNVVCVNILNKDT